MELITAAYCWQIINKLPHWTPCKIIPSSRPQVNYFRHYKCYRPSGVLIHRQNFYAPRSKGRTGGWEAFSRSPGPYTKNIPCIFSMSQIFAICCKIKKFILSFTSCTIYCILIYNIWVSHSCGYEELYLLRKNAVYSDDRGYIFSKHRFTFNGLNCVISDNIDFFLHKSVSKTFCNLYLPVPNFIVICSIFSTTKYMVLRKKA
jgi:hypothetical protein